MDHQAQLRKAGLKITHPRVTILQMLNNSGDVHLSAEEVYRSLLEKGEDLGLATVYRVLNQFEDADIVERHHFEGTKAVFELSDKPHHDHLICLDCGKVVEFNDDDIEERQTQIAEKNGLKLTNHSLQLFGKCIADCQNKQ